MEFFSLSPKRCQNLKEIQKVLDIPELKIVKPSDIRWLSHEKCVSTVKKCYGAIVSALETIYQESHEPEALSISKILSKPSTLFAIYLLDYILPDVSKLSKSLQTEKLDLSIISSLVDATLHTLEGVLQPAAKWVLDLQEVKEEMDITVGINFNSDDVASFQSRVTEPFYTKLKKISQTTSFHKMLSPVSAFLIPRRLRILWKTVRMEKTKLKYSLNTMGLSFQLKQL